MIFHIFKKMQVRQRSNLLMKKQSKVEHVMLRCLQKTNETDQVLYVMLSRNDFEKFHINRQNRANFKCCYSIHTLTASVNLAVHATRSPIIHFSVFTAVEFYV